jgi:hypothetical protein
MQLKNIDRILLFRTDAAGTVLTLEELQTRYGIDADGTNFYYGLGPNLASFAKTGQALSASHRVFFDAVLSSLSASPDDEKTVVLGVEPPDTDSYAFVAANQPLVTQLATELAAIQAQALTGGKRLNIVVRYTSEMNAGDTKGWQDPAGFKATFVQSRSAFAKAAPSILFSFSPALRADIDESQIAQFWPGDQYVDVIGGTWYTGSDAQRAASTATMRAYFLHRVGSGKPLALSELGGWNPGPLPGQVSQNDEQLQAMLHDLEALQLQNVTFKYVTFFLDGKSGTDATLAFLRSR